tara:strand:- start:2658 stop:3068 length:411 start_codon:yes stop_codon:yes gene_type:complete
MVLKEPCPKCGNNLYQEEYVKCIHCGWADWNRKRKDIRVYTNDIWKGNVHFVRYVGSNADLIKTTLKVTVKDDKSSSDRMVNILVPSCPHCGGDMQAQRSSSNSLVTTVIGITTFYVYRCNNRHLIQLSSTKLEWC